MGKRPGLTVKTVFSASLALTLLVALLPVAGAQGASTDGLCPADYTRPGIKSPVAAVNTPTESPAATVEASRNRTALESPSKLGGKWRALPSSPFASVHGVGVWAGDKMVAIDQVSGRTATYDPSTRRWEEHRRVPMGSGTAGWAFDRVDSAVWTGDEVIVLGIRAGRDADVATNYAFDPASGRWREVAPSPLETGGMAVWASDRLVVASSDRAAAAYDPVADCWQEMPDVPLPELPENARRLATAKWQVGSMEWTGNELLAVVAVKRPDVPIGIATFDPRTWTWESGPQGPVDAVTDDGIYADGRLWFMSEERNGRYTFNAAYDPATRHWEVVDTGCPLEARGAVWTGRLILEPNPRGYAFDPATGECFRLPRAKDRPRNTTAVVWTGREAIQWSGAWGDALRARPDGIAYRPPRAATTADKAQPIGKKLRQAIKARRRHGFDTDPAVVREISQSRYQPASRQFGFPMTREEYSDILSRGSFISGAEPVLTYVRRLPIFGGVWQDQRAGGALAIALTKADADVIAKIDSMMPAQPDLGWRLVIVPRSLKELKVALGRARKVSEKIDPSAMLWAAGLNQSDGLIVLMYDPDAVKRMRARKGRLERALGVPLRITSGRVIDL
ncbi:MAG: hypothetical protein ACC726_15305 [Chloroflexota bacterium]